MVSLKELGSVLRLASVSLLALDWVLPLESASVWVSELARLQR
jgi:hypothetical protein